MDNLENIMNILIFCVWSGIIILCIVLIVSGILRWISPENGGKSERDKKLYKLSWIGFIILCTILLVCNWSNLTSYFGIGSTTENKKLISIFIEVSQAIIKLLILGAIVISVLITFFLIAFCLYKAIKCIFCKANNSSSGDSSSGDSNLSDSTLTEELENKNKQFKVIIKTSFAKYIIIWGLLTIFLVMPLLIGSSDSIEGVWIDGIHQITNWGKIDTGNKQKQDNFILKDNAGTIDNEFKEEVFSIVEFLLHKNGASLPSEFMNSESMDKNICNTEEVQTSLFSDLMNYFLLFIVILGVGVAVVKILFSIMDNSFREKNGKEFLNEYSGFIEILSVGVALLDCFRTINFNSSRPFEIIRACTKSFAIVCFFVAATVLTLEVIRLLMDMREKLIRQEAKYLFVILVGQASLLLSRIATTIYDVVITIIGNTANNNDLVEFHEKIEEQMVQSMYDQVDDCREYEMTFSGFDRTVTKK